MAIPGSHADVVVVCTAAGNKVDMQTSPGDTVLKLKENLQDSIGEPASNMRLIHGAEILQDDWILSEHDVADGAALTLVLFALPFGTFELEPGSTPAGTNTFASALATFQSNAAVVITVDETEITSDFEDDDYDPYVNHAAFYNQYSGFAERGEANTFTIAISDVSTRINDSDSGLRVSREPHEFVGEICENDGEVRLEIPFKAGGCNDGVAGLRWITLRKAPASEG
eukprot:CAMPEP_0117459180 /NCGR_PEP_ID=MMETSP0784-20121206/1334_1 /TAXON_ID=39447 /ORGANISM="" /LENGTH=226 /DNA_ID=CAMNT_0005252763 /DNA_START=116 /DNA_END=793 /DNA_ORIENTATION=-